MIIATAFYLPPSPHPVEGGRQFFLIKPAIAPSLSVPRYLVYYSTNTLSILLVSFGYYQNKERRKLLSFLKEINKEKGFPSIKEETNIQ